MIVHRVTGIIIVILFLLILGTILGLTYIFNKQINFIKETQTQNNIQNVKTNQFLMSTINWTTQRQKTLLFMRDKIIAQWENVDSKKDYDRAYQKAEAIMRECERYPNLKPLFLLAIQCRESSFLDSIPDSATGKKTRMTSPVGARGAWQLMPSTARLLCEALNISCSDRIYTDIGISTRLAAKYFDILWATYENDTLSIADYNGGPWQAFYFQYDKSKLSKETEKFVSDVLASMYRFYREFSVYRIEKVLPLGGNK